MRSWVWLVLAVLSVPTLAAETEEAPLRLGELPSEAQLAQVLWQHSPDLLAARQRLAQSRGDAERAYLLPNPTLDASWNTVPVGPTNPPGQLNRLKDVPNYAFSLSELVELGKRGPRQRSMESARESARLDTVELLRQRYFDLLERVAEVATAELRVAALEDTAKDAARLTELQTQRQAHGDAAGLDVDRSQLEDEKIQSNLGEEREKLAAALLTCAQVAGLPCVPFGDRDRDRAYLAQRLAAVAGKTEALSRRPDLQSLEAQEASARAAVELADARAIPDPTLRVGYVYDQFIASGNQNQSVFVGVSLPLGLFDHGQADSRQAAATADSAAAQRAQLSRAAERDLGALTHQISEALTRRTKLREHTLPLAKSVVQRLDAAVRNGGAPLPDLLLARRTLYELSLDAADLDQLTYHLSVARSRTAGELPPLVAGLIPARR